jgi:hypothetical protein
MELLILMILAAYLITIRKEILMYLKLLWERFTS